MALDSAAIVQTFQQYDYEGTGTIKREKLVSLFQMLDANRFSPTELDLLLNTIDAGGTGVINYREFIDWLEPEAVQPEAGGQPPSRGEGHAWCESLSVAARYHNKHDVLISLTLADYTANVSDVLLEPAPVPGFCCRFSVETSSFHTAGDEPASLGVKIGQFEHFPMRVAWTDSAPWGAQQWEWQGKIAGHSIATPLREDSALMAALKGAGADGPPLDFFSGDFSAMTASEWDAALEACMITGPHEAPCRETPKALYVMAPSGGGKTTVSKLFAKSFGIDIDSSVRADGAIFRSLHKQYALVCDHGKANGGLWYRAWPAAKSIVQAAKKEMLGKAMEKKQDLVVSETGTKLKELVKNTERLKAAGYVVSVLCVYADPQEICARGIKRELDEGKRYNRDIEKVKETFKQFGPAISAANGTFKVVHNAQGQEPALKLEGSGCDGGELPGGVADALAALVGT